MKFINYLYLNKMRIDTKVFIGVFFILIGIMFFLEQVAYITFDLFDFIGIWWPIIFIAWGVNEISKKRSNFLLPIFGILSGGLLIADNMEMLAWGFWGSLWPIVFILIGLHFIFGKNSKFSLNPTQNKANSDGNCNDTAYSHNFVHNNSNVYSPDNLDVNVFFSGSSNQITSNSFRGGDVNVIFGGSELDFRSADLADEVVNIEVNAIFGGVEIYIPYNWQVEVYGTPVFGGVSNKTRYDGKYNPNNIIKPRTLKINYTVIFGGIEIKN